MFLRGIFPDRSVIGGGMWLFLEKIFLLIKGLLLTYLLANWVSQDVYGGYQFILAFLGAVSVVVYPGMGVAIVQAVARKKEGTFARAVRLMFWTAFFGSGALLVSSLYHIYSGNREIFGIFLVLAFVFPGYAVMNLWRYYYTGTEQFSRLVMMSVFLETISLILLLVALFFFDSLFGLVLLGIILPIPFSLALVWVLYTRSRALPSDEDNIRYGKKISSAVGLSTLAAYGDKLILGYFLGLSDLALYSIVLIIPEQAKGALVSFMTPLLPHYSKEKNRSGFWVHFLILLFCALASVLILYVLTPIIFEKAFPQYVDGISFSRLSLFILLFAPVVALETFLRACKNDRAVLRATFIGSISGLSLALLLVPFFGISGAIMAKIGGLLLQSGSFFLSCLSLNSNESHEQTNV